MVWDSVLIHVWIAGRWIRRRPVPNALPRERCQSET